MEPSVISVTELTRYIKGFFDHDPFLQNLWVEGELSNFKFHRSGHMYFTLKDERSLLRCVFFKGNNRYCKFLPSDGMNVWVRGNVSVYEKEGMYQFYVREMEPAGLGALYLAYEQLKKKFEAEGLFDARYKQELPRFPRCIGLVTSPTGAALQDILSTAEQRYPHVTFLVVETLVQGTGAPADIVSSIDYLNKRSDVDVIVLARGGGSLEDLWAFNSEEVAREIFNSRIPVVSAVGHETDFTIADFVADLRAPTPTGAVSHILPDIHELLNYIYGLTERGGKALANKIDREKQKLDHIIRRRFYQLPLQEIKKKREQQSNLEQHLKNAMINLLKERAYRFDNAQTRLNSLSPFKIMQRGYSYCENESGNLVNSVKDLKIRQLLKLNFIDGHAWSRVEDIFMTEESCGGENIEGK